MVNDEANMIKNEASNKVALIGCGLVGSSFAYALMQRGLASELVLIDKDRARAEGEAMDLNHGLPFVVRPMRIRAGEYSDVASADVVVICAGANQKPGETRLDLLEKNAQVFRDIVPLVLNANADAVIIIATNPVDILTQLSAEIAGLETGRVIGSGTILDTARLRTLLGAHYGIDPRSIHANVVAEHGDSSLALWSAADIGGVPLERFIGPNNQGYDHVALKELFGQTRTAAQEIIKRKGSTCYAIGLGLLSIVEAVLRDTHTVLTVSSPLRGRYGLDGMSLSLPSVIGRCGVECVLEVQMNDEERNGFERSAQLLTEQYQRL
jgi:L-lactate dehydrogenase